MAFQLNDLNYSKDSKERMPWEHYPGAVSESRSPRDRREAFHPL